MNANVAAEIVVRAKSIHLAPPSANVQYTPATVYGAPQYSQLPLSEQSPLGGASPNLTNIITSLDGTALQKLLGAMAQNSQTPSNLQSLQPQANFPNGRPEDLASLLSSVTRRPSLQQEPQHATGSQHQQNPYHGAATHSSFVNNQALSSLLNSTGCRPPSQAAPLQNQQPGHRQEVHDMMQQLAKWQQ